MKWVKESLPIGKSCFSWAAEKKELSMLYGDKGTWTSRSRRKLPLERKSCGVHVWVPMQREWLSRGTVACT